MKAIDWLLKACVLLLNIIATASVVHAHFAGLGYSPVLAWLSAALAVGLVDAAYWRAWIAFEQEGQNEAQALANLSILVTMTVITWYFAGVQAGFIGLLLRVSTVLSLFSKAGPEWLGRAQTMIELRKQTKSARAAFLATPEGMAAHVKAQLVLRSAERVAAALQSEADVVLQKRMEAALPAWFAPFGSDAPAISGGGEIKQLGADEWIASCSWCEFVQRYASQQAARAALSGHQKAHREVEITVR